MPRSCVARLGCVVATAVCLFGASVSANDKLTGHAAPAIAFESLDGGKTGLDHFHGKRVLVHFWATWCGACQKEMPELDRAQREATDAALVVLAVNVGEERKKVAEHVARHDYGFRVLLDPDWKAAERFGVIALPASFLIDERGIVRERVLGGELSREKLAAMARGAAGAVAAP